jgi:hypothetical protein
MILDQEEMMNAPALGVALLAGLTGLSIDRTQPTSAPRAVALAPDRLELHGVAASATTYQGREAIRLVEPGVRGGGGEAIVGGLTFDDGELRVDVAGRRGPLAIADDRGFVGLAFRVSAGAARYECIYLRPDNGRALDQERRNHATQYVSHPDFPWPLLRKQFPSKYESYVDLESGAWTSMRIVVRGATAALYVNGVAQPTLVVTDLRLPASRGGVALWIGPGSEAFFSNLTVLE